jgi:hypothetical protein
MSPQESKSSNSICNQKTLNSSSMKKDLTKVEYSVCQNHIYH